jgi:hypothetical protein
VSRRTSIKPDAQFGCGLLLGATVAFFILKMILGTGIDASSPLPTVRWPDWRHEYLSAYRGVSATHNLISLGMFGVGRRIREADVLFTGSSHAEFGFSAEELVAYFRLRGVSIKAYNIGVGFGEGFAFPSAIIDRYRLRDKVIVEDMYRVLTSPSKVAEEALHDNAGTRLVRLLNMWLSFSVDHALDGILAKVEVIDGRIYVHRQIEQTVMYRRWADGDLTEFWHGQLGHMLDHWSAPFNRPDPNAGSEQIDAEALRRVMNPERFAKLHLTVFATYIPWVSDTGQGSLTAAAHAGIPVLSLRGDKVQLLDAQHANHVGRAIVTEQIAAGLLNSGVKTP